MSEENKNKIEELLKRLSEKVIEDKKEKRDLKIDWLCSHVEEYLSPFVLIGYDVNGDAVVLNNAKTQQEIDSLMLSLGRYLSVQRMGGMGEDIGDL